MGWRFSRSLQAPAPGDNSVMRYPKQANNVDTREWIRLRFAPH